MRLRTLWIGLAIIVALLAIALAVFVATFDANRYRPTIVELVERHTGRTLTIDGELSLSVWPDLALSMGPTALSGPAGEGGFARIDSAKIGVALRPLLAREVHVERVALHGLRVDAIRHRDGSTNFDDLLARLESAGETNDTKPAPAAPAADAASAAATTVTIADVELRDASLGWLDEGSGDEWRLLELDLDADRIGSGEPGSIAMRGRLTGAKAGIDAQFDASGRYTADFATGRIELVDAKLDATTRDGIDAQLAVPAMTIDDGSIDGEPVALQLRMQREATKLDASLSTRLSAPAGQPIALRDIRADLTASGDGLPAGGARASLGGEGMVDPQRGTAALNLQGQVDEAPMQARLTVPKLSPLALQFDVQAERLDLDRFRGAPAQPANPAPAQQGTPARPKDEAMPVPVPPIADIDSSGSLRVGLLRAAGIEMRDLVMTLRSGNGRIELTRLAAGLYGGTLAGSGSVATNGRAALRMQLDDADVGGVLREFAQRDVLDGSGSVSVDLTGQGATVPALERSLAGSARIALRDGAILGIDLNQVLQKVETTIASLRGGGAAGPVQSGAGGGKTAFSSLDASFAIREGVAHNDDLDLRSPLLRVGGNGRIDIAGQDIDYLLRVSLVGTLAGQGGAARSTLRGITIPVRVSGPLASLSYSVEAEQLARDALKQEVTKRLEERLLGRDDGGKAGEEAGKSSKPTPKDLLRGLIGR